MKKIMIILISTLLLFSCKKEKVKEVPLPNSIAGLKIEKAKQEKIKDSISNIIINIEKRLSDLDTIKKLQLVSTLEISPQNFEHFISIQGNTKTDKNIGVRPISSGLITNVYIKEGQNVSEGQEMFQIDNTILRKSILEVESQLVLAKTTFERQKRLWDQKIGSEMQYLIAQNNKEALQNKIATLNSQLKNYIVRAPFSGVIDDLLVVKGDLASPQMPLAQIINLYNMYIEADVAENYLKSIKRGNKAVISLESLDKEINAKISQIGNSIHPENRTFKVRINVPNRSGAIKPNLLTDIRIRDFHTKNGIVIPTTLVQIDEDGNDFVFTVEKKDLKNIVIKKPIVVKSNYEEFSLISEGLSKDDILINEGSRSVSTAQEISIY
ncbi:MAG: efflux RND transporter periplasmic adaptor subunit [Saprospiraceae bacterium]